MDQGADCHFHAVSVPGPLRAADELALLLVCCDPSWLRAVQDAVADLGRNQAVIACNPRDAVVHLATSNDRYSHLLVERGCGHGLMDVLTQLTSSAAGSDTEMLLLGTDAPELPNIGVIRSATSHSVREALMLRPSPSARPVTDLDLSEVKAALEAASISVRYQPIVRLNDRKLIGLEVLARLDHPVVGTVLPDRFVPQIEDAGLAEELTEIVATRAFSDMTGPHLSGEEPFITINFPLQVLVRSEAIVVLERQRAAAGIPTSRVVVELTERTPVEDFDKLRQAVEHVRSLGYRVAIDDVVPGLPGLETLLTIPFTSIKLDKEVVGQHPTDDATGAFVGDMVKTAHAAGLKVIAEGVETVEAWQRMRNLGVDAAQGFLIARPLPAAAIPAWLDGWRSAAPFI
ncbi:MAG: EAL domain-containing protein [Acetobacteraceae bacterium]